MGLLWQKAATDLSQQVGSWGTAPASELGNKGGAKKRCYASTQVLTSSVLSMFLQKIRQNDTKSAL